MLVQRGAGAIITGYMRQRGHTVVDDHLILGAAGWVSLKERGIL
jgi:hypothetical protein